MITLPTHKRGDSYGMLADATGSILVNGVEVTDLAPLVITSQVRTLAGTLVQELEVVRFASPDDGKFALRADAGETAVWPVGTLKLDVQFATPDGIVVSSATFRQPIEEDVTHA